MNEDEYWQGEPQDDDDILDDYLMNEDMADDITFIHMPKIVYDFEKSFDDQYYTLLKRCKSKDEMKNVLLGIVNHAVTISMLEHEINYLQDRAKDLELNVHMILK